MIKLYCMKNFKLKLIRIIIKGFRRVVVVLYQKPKEKV